jgi:hypothetical protein
MAEWRFQSEREILEIKDLLKQALGIDWYEKIDGSASETIESIKFLIQVYLLEKNKNGNKEERQAVYIKQLLKKLEEEKGKKKIILEVNKDEIRKS